MRRFIFLFIIAMSFAAAQVGAVSASPHANSRGGAVRLATASYCAEPEELAMLDLINSYRAEKGLSPLVLSPTLGAAARHHSESMAEHNYFDGTHDLHEEGSADGGTVSWQQNIADFGYPDNIHTNRGENIAAGNETAAATFQQWRGSPAHNEHLLSDQFYAIGIGRAVNPDADYGWYWTATFGSLVDDVATGCETRPTRSGEPAAAAQPLSIVAGGHSKSSTDAALAFDGDETSAWQTTSKSTPKLGQVWFDLGERVVVSRVRWRFSESGGADAFEIQVSDDRDTWQTISSQSDAGTTEWQSLDWSGSARFVRFRFSNPTSAPVLGYLAEVEIDG